MEPQLDPNIILCGSITGLVPRIENTSRLDEEQLDLTVGKWLVFHSLRDHEHLAGGEVYGAVPEVDAQPAFEDDERLVRVLVVMPDEVAFQPHDLELVVVHLRDDLWLPLLREEREFLLEVDCLRVH